MRRNKAHSDGDVAIHALCDALLGALALGDIGKHFPDTSDKFKGADSMQLLTHVYSLINEKGYILGNADITILAQAPKMAEHIPAMKEFLANDLNSKIEDINIKATTTEKMGYNGLGEGIHAHAVVIVIRLD